jgi:hypothetical protein
VTWRSVPSDPARASEARAAAAAVKYATGVARTPWSLTACAMAAALAHRCWSCSHGELPRCDRMAAARSASSSGSRGHNRQRWSVGSASGLTAAASFHWVKELSHGLVALGWATKKTMANEQDEGCHAATSAGWYSGNVASWQCYNNKKTRLPPGPYGQDTLPLWPVRQDNSGKSGTILFLDPSPSARPHSTHFDSHAFNSRSLERSEKNPNPSQSRRCPFLSSLPRASCRPHHHESRRSRERDGKFPVLREPSGAEPRQRRGQGCR